MHIYMSSSIYYYYTKGEKSEVTHTSRLADIWLQKCCKKCRRQTSASLFVCI